EIFAKTEIATADLRVEEWGTHERTIYASDSETDPRFAHPITRLLAHKSLLIQPMRWKGATIGGFAIAWLKDQHRFTTDELALAGGARADPGGSRTRPRHRARSPPFQPAARVRAADDGPQRGAGGAPRHGAPPGRVRRDHARRGVRPRAPARGGGRAAHQAGV